jgi:toxin ParE1/3/4
MNSFQVLFSPKAEANLLSIYRYIAIKSSERIAAGYIQRLRAECLSLAMLPNRGTLQTEVSKDIRTMGVDRSSTIAFRVLQDSVVILGIHYRGRNVRAQIAERE